MQTLVVRDSQKELENTLGLIKMQESNDRQILSVDEEVKVKAFQSFDRLSTEHGKPNEQR